MNDRIRHTRWRTVGGVAVFALLALLSACSAPTETDDDIPPNLSKAERRRLRKLKRRQRAAG